MKINRLAVFFVCFFFFFFFFFQQISDRQSLFPLEETLKYWAQIIIFLRKEQNGILALNLRDSGLRIKTFIRVPKSCRAYLAIPM